MIGFLLKNITLKLYLILLICSGWVGLLYYWAVYRSAEKKADQYVELNIFLEKRLSELSTERTGLEKSFHGAIQQGMRTQNKIEIKKSKDYETIWLNLDTLGSDVNQRIFEKKYGKIRQSNN